MKKKKIIFDLLFVLISAIFLTVLNHYGLLEKYVGYALIPLLAAYFIGQQVERKFIN